jgi:ferritin-like protein
MVRESSFETTIQESILKPLKSFAERLRRLLAQPAGGEILSTLEEDCRAESHLARQLRAHTLLMPANLFRETYTQIAIATEQHAQLLAERLQALGGTLPSVVSEGPPVPAKAATIWRLIAADIAAIDARSNRYQQELGWVTDPDAQQILPRLRAAKHRQRTTLSNLLARVDSYAIAEINHYESR